MNPTHLMVRARGTALVQDLEALDHDLRRYIGRHIGEADGVPSFIPNDEPSKIPNRHEYRRKVVEGSLEACDAETAEACFGVGWSSKWKPEVEPAKASKKGDV